MFIGLTRETLLIQNIKELRCNECIMATPSKRVILGLVGNECSTTFLIQWSETILELSKQGYSIGVSTGISKNPLNARIMSLGCGTLYGKEQKPFNGSSDYDVFISIDTETIFTPKQVIELIEDTDKYPIVSGVHRMVNSKNMSFRENEDQEYFKKHGGYEFANIESVNPNKKHIRVKHTELGIFACTREVFEKLEYPYFRHQTIEIPGEDDKTLLHVPTESEAFCMNANAAGIAIHVNTDVRVGHEYKTIS